MNLAGILAQGSVCQQENPYPQGRHLKLNKQYKLIHLDHIWPGFLDLSLHSLTLMTMTLLSPILAMVGVLASPAAPAPEAGSADVARLAKARDAMRPLGRETVLGPWRLLTDVASGELNGLGAVVSHLPEAFSARYSLPAAPGPGQAVVIFASDVRYRAFAAADGYPVVGTLGHAGAGLAAFPAGQIVSETRVALVHGLTRLLAQMALGPTLPGWLDEGLATDLAWCEVDAAGRLVPDTIDLFEVRRAAPATAVEKRGPRVTADEWLARARAGHVAPLSAVAATDSRLFANPGARADAATASAMLVRWCLAEPARAAAFRGLLASVSRGGAGDLNALAAALGTGTRELQESFSRWLKKP